MPRKQVNINDIKQVTKSNKQYGNKLMKYNASKYQKNSNKFKKLV